MDEIAPRSLTHLADAFPEVDAAVAAQLPALAKGLDIDEAIDRIDAQARSQIQ